jgi:hypothetical protein
VLVFHAKPTWLPGGLVGVDAAAPKYRRDIDGLRAIAVLAQAHGIVGRLKAKPAETAAKTALCKLLLRELNSLQRLLL